MTGNDDVHLSSNIKYLSARGRRQFRSGTGHIRGPDSLEGQHGQWDSGQRVNQGMATWQDAAGCRPANHTTVSQSPKLPAVVRNVRAYTGLASTCQYLSARVEVTKSAPIRPRRYWKLLRFGRVYFGIQDNRRFCNLHRRPSSSFTWCTAISRDHRDSGIGTAGWHRNLRSICFQAISLKGFSDIQCAIARDMIGTRNRGPSIANIRKWQ